MKRIFISFLLTTSIAQCFPLLDNPYHSYIEPKAQDFAKTLSPEDMRDCLQTFVGKQQEEETTWMETLRNLIQNILNHFVHTYESIMGQKPLEITKSFDHFNEFSMYTHRSIYRTVYEHACNNVDNPAVLLEGLLTPDELDAECAHVEKLIKADAN